MMWDIGCSISMAICLIGVIGIFLWVWSNENK